MSATPTRLLSLDRELLRVIFDLAYADVDAVYRAYGAKARRPVLCKQLQSSDNALASKKRTLCVPVTYRRAATFTTEDAWNAYFDGVLPVARSGWTIRMVCDLDPALLGVTPRPSTRFLPEPERDVVLAYSTCANALAKRGEAKRVALVQFVIDVGAPFARFHAHEAARMSGALARLPRVRTALVRFEADEYTLVDTYWYTFSTAIARFRPALQEVRLSTTGRGMVDDVMLEFLFAMTNVPTSAALVKTRNYTEATDRDVNLNWIMTVPTQSFRGDGINFRRVVFESHSGWCARDTTDASMVMLLSQMAILRLEFASDSGRLLSPQVGDELDELMDYIPPRITPQMTLVMRTPRPAMAQAPYWLTVASA